MSVPRLVMEKIVKQFGPTRALDGVDLELLPGEIHAIVGENGAGKSTLMAILSGSIRPDSGRMFLDGSSYQPTNPREARRWGVAIVHQELSLLPHLDVEANVLLGVETARAGFLNNRVNRTRVQKVLAELDHPEIDPALPVEQLSIAHRQIVEIARGLLIDVKVLILDEPTSALNRADVVKLFELMRRLRDRGVTVIFISHFLEEVETVADRFTVLRDGQRIVTAERRAFARATVIEQMVGRRIDEQFPHVPHHVGEPLLRLENVISSRGTAEVSLVLHRGEILGIAGLVGAGRTELLRGIYGLDPIKSGRIIIGSHIGNRGDPSSRIEQGVGLLSDDRKAEGLALDQSILDNVTWSRLRPHSRWGFLRLGSVRDACRACLDRLHTRYFDPLQSVETLSGGNQQKVALARLLHQNADIWLLDEPTKGIDIGSKAEIYRLIGDLAAQGKGILLVSNDLHELLGVCDRIAAMHRGRLVEVRETRQWTPSELLKAIVGESSDSISSISALSGGV